MKNTRVLIGTFFLTVSSLALAAGPQNPGHASGGAAHPGAASASEHGGARASAAAGVMPSGPFKGYPVTQVSQETFSRSIIRRQVSASKPPSIITTLWPAASAVVPKPMGCE